MMFERFTDNARHVVVGAQQAAHQTSARRIGTEHLLLALTWDRADCRSVAGQELADAGVDAGRARDRMLAGVTGDGGLDPDPLKTIGIDLHAVRARAEDAFGLGALDHPPATARGRATRQLPFTAAAKSALRRSVSEARRLGDDRIGAEHLLLGLLHDDAGPALALLTDLGVTPEHLRARLITRRDGAA